MHSLSILDMAGRATSGPPSDPAAIPETVSLSPDRSTLTLSWRDGSSAGLPSSRLRSRCRCAWCTRSRIDGTFPADFSDVTLTGIEPLGGYALHLGFSDAHARGIFPWSFLRDIALDPDPSQPDPSVPGRSFQP